MEFSPFNNVVKRCLQGMDMEEKDKPEEASRLFCKVGMKRQTTLKNSLQLIMWPDIKKQSDGKLL